MSKHTPGPWFVDAHKNVVAEGGGLVAFPCISAGFDQEANARLIAAAPETAAERDRLKEINAELLDALTEIVAAADGNGWKQLDATFAAPRAAIAKAKGSTP